MHGISSVKQSNIRSPMQIANSYGGLKWQSSGVEMREFRSRNCVCQTPEQFELFLRLALPDMHVVQ